MPRKGQNLGIPTLVFQGLRGQGWELPTHPGKHQEKPLEFQLDTPGPSNAGSCSRINPAGILFEFRLFHDLKGKRKELPAQNRERKPLENSRKFLPGCTSLIFPSCSHKFQSWECWHSQEPPISPHPNFSGMHQACDPLG